MQEWLQMRTSDLSCCAPGIRAQTVIAKDASQGVASDKTSKMCRVKVKARPRGCASALPSLRIVPQLPILPPPLPLPASFCHQHKIHTCTLTHSRTLIPHLVSIDAMTENGTFILDAQNGRLGLQTRFETLRTCPQSYFRQYICYDSALLSSLPISKSQVTTRPLSSIRQACRITRINIQDKQYNQASLGKLPPKMPTESCPLPSRKEFLASLGDSVSRESITCGICLQETRTAHNAPRNCPRHGKKPERTVVVHDNHKFGKRCITAWLKKNNSCPLCRKQLFIKPKPRSTVNVDESGAGHASLDDPPDLIVTVREGQRTHRVPLLRTNEEGTVEWDPDPEIAAIQAEIVAAERIQNRIHRYLDELDRLEFEDHGIAWEINEVGWRQVGLWRLLQPYLSLIRITAALRWSGCRGGLTFDDHHNEVDPHEAGYQRLVKGRASERGYQESSKFHNRHVMLSDMTSLPWATNMYTIPSLCLRQRYQSLASHPMCSSTIPVAGLCSRPHLSRL
ncbi:uncharacterized protein MYCFIDRAFT_207339 [Pseudocercospora fijiensis CIRAD86]|uniref:RING-type domain-containing protein n=1 Tax=Pseudocercospora fijiensis (strain CIRAD86) TaxID=383855 RepID=M3A0B7_PSEFD|nr:uncharacterized protein MYCFIDRAFT_207339 [Pseudocercospora fijiensis CIRAD86]EME84609.1 hypothetical protein MYCFIDRAFT_207339 [Pseudocercospora fijiensis CIRAD86]